MLFRSLQHRCRDARGSRSSCVSIQAWREICRYHPIRSGASKGRSLDRRLSRDCPQKISYPMSMTCAVPPAASMEAYPNFPRVAPLSCSGPEASMSLTIIATVDPSCPDARQPRTAPRHAHYYPTYDRNLHAPCIHYLFYIPFYMFSHLSVLGFLFPPGSLPSDVH